MRLHLLFQTDCLTASYDLGNDWLYLDWRGELTLADVQAACLKLTQYFLHRPYSRVLNSNEQVTSVGWDIAAWLATDFLPHMSLAGVKHVAWIYSPSLRGRSMLQTILNWLPGPIITSFNDLATAVEWLQHTRSEREQGYLLPQRSPAIQARLVQEAQALSQRVAASRQRQRV